MPLEGEQIFFSLLGISVFVGLLTWAAFHSTELWRSFVVAYPRPDTLPVARGRMENIIIYKSQRPETALKSNSIIKRPGPAFWQKIPTPYLLIVAPLLLIAVPFLLFAAPLILFATPFLFYVSPYRYHVGVILRVVDGGLLLSRVFPFNFLCPPIYLPFTGMTIRPTYWALWREPEAIRMKLLPDTDIILGQKVAQWLREHKT